MAALGLSDKEVITKNVKFSNDRHARNILQYLNVSRKTDNLCDGTVIIGEDRVKVQKAVLSAASHYFRLIYSYDGIDGKPQSEVDLTSLGIRLDTLELILDYIYTSEINLSEDNIQDLLQASDVLLLGDLKDMCCEYLEGCITLQNCLGISEFAALFTCPWIYWKVMTYIDQNFKEVTYTEEFGKLTTPALQTLLSRDTLTLQSETDIMDAIIRWYQCGTANRQTDVVAVIQQCLRVGNCDAEYLQKLKDSELCAEVPEIWDQCIYTEYGNDIGRPRGMKEVIMITGGEGEIDDPDGDDYDDNGLDDGLEVKDVSRCISVSKQDPHMSLHRWLNMAPMMTKRAGHGLVHCGGCAYAIGGRDEKRQVLSSGEKYDPSTNTWSPIADMTQGRMQVSLAVIDDNIYAVGGLGNYNNMDPLASVEVYNIFSNTWRSLPDMNLKRIGFSCVALHKKLYVMAGGFMGKPYEAVECFDTRTETWHSASPLREKRYNGRAVVVGDEIYIFGGVRRFECPSANPGNNLKFCDTEVYSTRTEKWEPIKSRQGTEGLSVRLEQTQVFCALSNNEDMYALGYLDQGSNSIQSVRSYNRYTNTWHCAIKCLPNSQMYYSGCLIKIPVCAMDELERKKY